MAELPRGASDLPRLPMKSSPLSVLADQGMTILSKVDEATKRINQLLGDENQERFSSLLGNLSDAAGNVSAVTRAMNTTLREQVVPAVQEFPGLAQDARKAMQAMERAGNEAEALAQDVRTMAVAIEGPGGALEQITASTQGIARAADQFDRATLPGISQAASDVSSAARRMGSAAAGLARTRSLCSMASAASPARVSPASCGTPTSTMRSRAMPHALLQKIVVGGWCRRTVLGRLQQIAPAPRRRWCAMTSAQPLRWWLPARHCNRLRWRRYRRRCKLKAARGCATGWPTPMPRSYAPMPRPAGVCNLRKWCSSGCGSI